MAPRYYLEHDGRVRVVERDGSIELPTEPEVDVPFHETARREIAGVDVVFGQADLDEHPWDWPTKDELVTQPETSRVLRGAINASLFRPVVGVVLRSEEDQVLLVQPARGVAQGHWTLPGGFLHAFEQPQDGARREVEEEVGLGIEDLELIGTVSYHHPGSTYPILGLAFTGRATGGPVSPDPDEIAQARWFSKEEAKKRSAGFAATVLDRAMEGRDP